MRLLVTGGRHYTDYWTVDEVLTGLQTSRPVTCLIVGGALGVDRFARSWAQRNGIAVETYNADWTKYGPRAGPIRNALMISARPDSVVAFPGGRCTADCVRQAKAAGIPVIEIVDPNPVGTP